MCLIKHYVGKVCEEEDTELLHVCCRLMCSSELSCVGRTLARVLG
jgi:hypothetical protein